MSKKKRLEERTVRILVDPQEIISASDMREIINAINEEVTEDRVTITPREGGSITVQPEKPDEVKTNA